MKRFSKEIRLQESGKHYWAGGLSYGKLRDNDISGTFCTYHQASIPLYYGLRVQDNITFEAGAYVGFLLNKPFGNVFFEPTVRGIASWRYGPSAGAMLGVNYMLPGDNILQLQYRYETIDGLGTLGSLRLGFDLRF